MSIWGCLPKELSCSILYLCEFMAHDQLDFRTVHFPRANKTQLVLKAFTSLGFVDLLL